MLVGLFQITSKIIIALIYINICDRNSQGPMFNLKKMLCGRFLFYRTLTFTTVISDLLHFITKITYIFLTTFLHLCHTQL